MNAEGPHEPGPLPTRDARRGGSLHPSAADAPSSPILPGGNPGPRLARASCWLAVLAILLGLLLNWLAKSPAVVHALMFLIVILFVTGLLLALVALLGTRRWGRRDVVGPALGGLVISGLMLVVMINRNVQ